MYLFTTQLVIHPADAVVAPVVTKQLATIRAEPVLQLFVVQHDVAVPDVGVPVLVAVHVVPDAAHV